MHFRRELDFNTPTEVQSDTYSAMTRRLKNEINERDALAKGIFARAVAGNRDLTDDELALLRECRSRMAKHQNRLLEIQEAIRAFST